jgi:hypothetical protein
MRRIYAEGFIILTIFLNKDHIYYLLMMTELEHRLLERRSVLSIQHSNAANDHLRHQLKGAIGEIDNLMNMIKAMPEPKKEEEIHLMKPLPSEKISLMDNLRSIFKE